MALTKPPVLPAWAETGDKVQPTNAEIQAGWPLSNVPPARQRWNWILNFAANGIRYLTRRGLPDWANDENYEIGDCTRGPDGLSYKALTNNINKSPAANPADWVRWAFSANESINQNFAGLVRSLTPTGGALVREWADTVAATTGNIEIGQSYNCAVDPVTGVWAGRDVADICWLEKWSDVGGVKEFWYAPTAAAGAVPAWVKVYSLDMVGGGMYLAQEAGHVAFFARSTAPAGYLKANGALVSRATYANLFASIGTAFGAGDGATTFALPDLRGEFLRGFDDARGIDGGRVFGSSQADEFKSHNHAVNLVADPSPSWNGVGTGYAVAADSANSGVVGTMNMANAGGTETRPRNVAMLACIKY